ncbi:MAG: hypothetical protein RRX94_04535, partial [Raoultibacter sp.]
RKLLMASTSTKLPDNKAACGLSGNVRGAFLKAGFQNLCNRAHCTGTACKRHKACYYEGVAWQQALHLTAFGQAVKKSTESTN